MTIQTLLEACDYLKEDQLEVIKKAYAVAEKAHEGQKRKSQEPYITHPLAVAGILANLQMDVSVISAGLLHDVIEDTKLTREQLEQAFGHDVADLVEGVTKLGTLNFKSVEEEQAENFRKMFLAMAKDIRVVIIKLADRLHNMRTIKYHSVEKQLKIAKETKDIFAPLAHRLGIWKLKWELEDLSFSCLQPEEFQIIKDLISQKRETREKAVEKYCAELAEGISKTAIKAKIIGRPKHFYSIYKKVKNSHLTYDELYDILGVRIIVDSIRECYEVLGIVHSKFKPIAGRFKDYIAMPKSNLYQSLHTSVIADDGHPVEVQIRTKTMHQIAEYGIAAHWRYKEGGKSSKDKEFGWLRQIIDGQQENVGPGEYLNNLKVDLFVDEVFVFSPKGDVTVLPKGATPVDFAYKVHTEVGNMCMGAKVNGHIVTLNYELKSGDRIAILTSKNTKPNADWLSFVKTNQARTKIKQWIRKQSREENVKKGREKLEKVLVLEGMFPKDVLSKDILQECIRQFNFKFEDEFFIHIYEGDLSTREIIKFLQKKLKINQEPAPGEAVLPPPKPQRTKKSPGNISVLGETNVYTTIAKCCHPVPGDAIEGYITQGRGVSIHKSDCPHIRNMSDQQKARLIAVEWNKLEEKELYEVLMRVEAFDRVGLLNEILSKITDSEINLKEVLTKRLNDGGNMRALLVLEIRDLKQLQHIKQAIAQISDVYFVGRSESKVV